MPVRHRSTGGTRRRRQELAQRWLPLLNKAEEYGIDLAYEIHPNEDLHDGVTFERFLAATGVEVAGIEFITDAEGTSYTYDVNTNTNYNPEAEARSGRSGMTTIARFLGAELARLSEPRHRTTPPAEGSCLGR